MHLKQFWLLEMFSFYYAQICLCDEALMWDIDGGLFQVSKYLLSAMVSYLLCLTCVVLGARNQLGLLALVMFDLMNIIKKI